jgi:hypothetical protein
MREGPGGADLEGIMADIPTMTVSTSIDGEVSQRSAPARGILINICDERDMRRSKKRPKVRPIRSDQTRPKPSHTMGPKDDAPLKHLTLKEDQTESLRKMG